MSEGTRPQLLDGVMVPCSKCSLEMVNYPTVINAQSVNLIPGWYFTEVQYI